MEMEIEIEVICLDELSKMNEDTWNVKAMSERDVRNSGYNETAYFFESGAHSLLFRKKKDVYSSCFTNNTTIKALNLFCLLADTYNINIICLGFEPPA